MIIFKSVLLFNCIKDRELGKEVIKMRMIKCQTAAYISTIQYVAGAAFGYSFLFALLSGVLITFILNMFGTQIDLDDEVTPRDDDYDNQSNVNNNDDNAKTREELRNKRD